MSKSEYQRKYREENKQLLKAKRKKYGEENKEILKAKNKIYEEAHKEARKEYHKKWSKENPEKLKASRKAYRVKNKEKYNERQRKWNLKNKTYSRAYLLKKLYNLSLGDYDKLLTNQSGLCGLCKCSLEGTIGTVDHCHVTLQIRGILHHKCNSLLGFAHDDTGVLKLAIEYLQRSREEK